MQDQQAKRVAKLVAHLSAASEHVASGALERNLTASQKSVFGAVGSRGDDDVVIVSARRTAIAKARKGKLKDTTPDDLLVAVFKAVIEESKINPELIEDVSVGNVQLGGAYAMPARTAALRAGIPDTAGLRSINRQCSSGIQAVNDIAMAIKTGQIEVGIGAGVESMTNGGNPSDPSQLPPFNMNEIFASGGAPAACLTPMGVTSENVAEKFNITREEQDKLAVESHKRALAAQAAGKFDKEIVPVKTIVEDAEGNETEIVFDKDEGPREGTTLEGLAKLKPAFKKGGSTTAGNSSQVSDGAAAVLMMTRAKAKELGLPIKGVFRGAKVVGLDPSIMGIGPALAIPALMEDTQFKLEDVDVIELNEAFASQATYCIKKLNLDMNKVNPNGGAIALGHPLGETGARMVATLLPELERRKPNGPSTGIVSMCIGTGMGFAALIEGPQN